MTGDPKLLAYVAKLEKRLARFKARLSKYDRTFFGQYWLTDYAYRVRRGSQVLKKADSLLRKIINLQCEDTAVFA